MARPAKRLSVSGEDKHELEKLLASGVAQVRVVLRALALRQMSDGRSASEAAGMVRLTGKAVRELAERYRAGGLERALCDKQRPGRLGFWMFGHDNGLSPWSAGSLRRARRAGAYA
jgi:hypothetical protein